MDKLPEPPDFLDPLTPITIGDVVIVIDRVRPVAALLRGGGQVDFATWSDSDVPGVERSPDVHAAPTSVWVVYSENGAVESGEAARSGAVRITTDGSVATVDLDLLEVVGVDDDGVWGLLGSDGERDEVVASFSAHEPPEIDLSDDAPIEEYEDLHPEEFARSAGLINAADDDQHGSYLPLLPSDGDDDQHGGFEWRFGLEDENEDDAADVDGLDDDPDAPVVPVPTDAVVLVRRRLDGTNDAVEVDRLVIEVSSTGESLHIVYQPTTPVVTREDFGALTYSYPRASIDIDVSAGLPQTIAVGDNQSTPLRDEDWNTWGDDADGTTDDGEPPLAVDLRGVEGTRWALRSQTPEQVASAIEEVRASLADLGEPVSVWTRRDDKWHRMRSDYRDVEVDVAGEWPTVHVIMKFRYRMHGDMHFRFTVPVFDGSGRAAVQDWLTVTLMEDLHTGDFSDRKLSADGFVDMVPTPY